jgi:ABC-type oligopeptide transport system substrate-binding subunit
MFAGFEVPNVDNVFGVNATGFSDPDYDRACSRILIGSSSSDTYYEAIGTTERIFRDQMPSIPLYILPRLLAFGSEVCGPKPDPTTFNLLWNIEEYGSGENCEK